MKLCLSLADNNLDRLTQKTHHYAGQVDLIEVRLDRLDEPALPELPTSSSTKFLATCRPAREGGDFNGPEEARLAILKQAAGRFDWIDLEHDACCEVASLAPSRVLRSRHIFRPESAKISELADSLRRLDGDGWKLAITVETTRQLCDLLLWMERDSIEQTRCVIGMGAAGEASRIVGAFTGNCWTYVSEREELQTAPGQFCLQTARDVYRLGSRHKRPPLLGLLGNPVAHSLSPRLHNRLFADHQLPYLYLPILLDDAGRWLRYLQQSALEYHGFSVTIPFKKEISRLVPCDDSGSVNTLYRQDGSWCSANTDLAGFLQPIRKMAAEKGFSAVVLGNGGVAETVVEALKPLSSSILVAGRDVARVKPFAARHGGRWCLLEDLNESADLFVNTTPVGQYPDVDVSPLRSDQLSCRVVYDLVYNPVETKLLQMARRQGLGTISGIEMFIEQAALQFELWTGIRPDRNHIRRLVFEPQRRKDAKGNIFPLL